MAAGGPEQAAKPVPLSSLEVMIDFDLGRTAVSLSDLESWKAGSVVTLDPPSRADGVEVTLRANGQVIGTGDLVKIDDRLGVRISRLLFAT
jgi:flagellar motor switch/type III secretory pathway protein FliN